MAREGSPGIAMLIARKVAKAQPWSKSKGGADGDEEGSDAEEESESPDEEKQEGGKDAQLGSDLRSAWAAKDDAAIVEAIRAICR